IHDCLVGFVLERIHFLKGDIKKLFTISVDTLDSCWYVYWGLRSLSMRTERTPSKKSLCRMKFSARMKSVRKHASRDFFSPSINCFNVTFKHTGDFDKSASSVW